MSLKNKEGKFILDFYADWCGPCKMLSPILDNLIKENGVEVIKVNVDDEPEISQEYNIRGIPTLVFVNNGNEKQRLVGMNTKEHILSIYNSI